MILTATRCPNLSPSSTRMPSRTCPKAPADGRVAHQTAGTPTSDGAHTPAVCLCRQRPLTRVRAPARATLSRVLLQTPQDPRAQSSAAAAAASRACVQFVCACPGPSRGSGRTFAEDIAKHVLFLLCVDALECCAAHCSAERPLEPGGDGTRARAAPAARAAGGRRGTAVIRAPPVVFSAPRATQRFRRDPARGAGSLRSANNSAAPLRRVLEGKVRGRDSDG